MKKLLTIFSICITACILFSSCGSNMSIAKRHYNKGYYIEYAKRAPTTNPQKAGTKIAQTKKALPSQTVQNTAKQTTVHKQINQDIQPIPAVVTAGNENRPYKATSKTSSKSTLPQNIASSETPVLQTNQTASDISGYHGDGGGERAALSLLWIVIIIILILWLIGILAGGFGLGGLINLLLVIALILLILWLLRVW
jgi:hypothetical protein